MLVFRVEDHEGRGPYHNKEERASKICDELCASHNPHSSGRICGAVDGLSWSNSYRYGFTTTGKLYWWFRGFVVKLRKAGFKLSVYRVPKRYVQQGKSGLQCVFVIDKAIKIGEL